QHVCPLPQKCVTNYSFLPTSPVDHCNCLQPPLDGTTVKSQKLGISAGRLGSSWSGTGWHDRNWSFLRVILNILSSGPVVGALVNTVYFTGWTEVDLATSSGEL